MRLTIVTAVLAIAAMTAVFSTGQAEAQQQNPNTPQAQNVITIMPGDTLSSVASRHGTTYVRLFNANPGIANPNVIYPGSNIRVPAAEEQLPDRFAAATAATTPSRPATPTPSAFAPPAQPRAAAPTTTSYSGGGSWNKLAQCESGGNWSINSGNGYYGGLQFSLSSWRAVGGSGYPHEASAAEQIARAEILRAKQGWGAWPACSAKLGL